MRPTLRLLAGVSAFSLAACAPATEAPAVLDSRTAVPLPAEAVEAVHAEMRMMLTSIHDLNLALVNRDSAMARKAAIASGVAAAADPELEPLLPAEFLKLALATHSTFDSLAAAVAVGATRDSLLTYMPRLTANCVACHALYRLVASAEKQ